jgi:hypothetical protein
MLSYYSLTTASTDSVRCVLLVVVIRRTAERRRLTVSNDAADFGKLYYSQPGPLSSLKVHPCCTKALILALGSGRHRGRHATTGSRLQPASGHVGLTPRISRGQIFVALDASGLT